LVLLFDVYGVIIVESKGNFTPYVYSRFPETDRKFFRELYLKASTGIIDGREFFNTLGFDDPESATRDYVENHLTPDGGFLDFAKRFIKTHEFALLSNDVAEWSERVRSYHKFGDYFKHAIISADAGCRKPERRIFEIALERLGVPARECVFIDDSVQNLDAASGAGMNTILFNRDGEEYSGDIANDFIGLAEIVSKKYGD